LNPQGKRGRREEEKKRRREGRVGREEGSGKMREMEEKEA